MVNSLQIPILQLNFSLPLRPNEIPLWRGAVNKSVGAGKDAFHNHREEALLYRYPLIQYRTCQDKAAVFGIGEGSHLLRNWVLEAPPAVQIGQQLVPLHLDNVLDKIQTVAMTKQAKTYYIHNYLPLNTANYQQWLQKDTLKERVDLLESVLIGHLLNFATGIQWLLPEHLDLSLLNIHETKKRKHKVSRISFNLSSKTNMQLLDGIALGKGVSHGFGYCVLL